MGGGGRSVRAGPGGAVGAAGCIAGYFNLTVSATLLLTLAGMALLKAGFKVYYRNRF